MFITTMVEQKSKVFKIEPLFLTSIPVKIKFSYMENPIITDWVNGITTQLYIMVNRVQK